MDEEAILRELGSRIRAQRKRIGLSQEQLALVAGVDRSYFGAVERGERNITFLVLYRLCVALRCDVAHITGDLPFQQFGGA
jgi:transcriptional regulator with XRE-family HTH domain